MNKAQETGFLERPRKTPAPKLLIETRINDMKITGCHKNHNVKKYIFLKEKKKPP